MVLGQQITWAAASEMEYRFERMVPRQEQSWSFNTPSDIAVAPDGSIWVNDISPISEAKYTQRLQHFNADGSYINTITIQDNAANGAILDFAAGQDGSLWIVDYFNNRIQHFNTSGSLIGQFGSKGTDAGQLDGPRSIALNNDGTVWVVADFHRLQHLSAEGVFISGFGSEGQDAGKFYQLDKVRLGNDGSVWALDYGGGRIQHFTADGKFIAQYWSEGNEPGLFGLAYDFQVAQDSSLWLVDYSNNRLQHFSVAGLLITESGGYSNAPGQFNNPSSIALAPDGSIWVVDQGNGRIQHFRADGTFIAQIGNRSNSIGYFSYELGGVAVANDNSVWVADTVNDRLQHFDKNGLLIGQFVGGINDLFYRPYDIVIASDGSGWLSSSGRLQHIKTDGSVITIRSYYQSVRGGGSPFSLGIAADNSLWVVSVSGGMFSSSVSSIEHLNTEGSSIAQFTYSTSDFLAPHNAPFGIAPEKDGSIWLINSNNQIQHFQNDGLLITTFGVQGSDIGQFNSPSNIILDHTKNSLWIADSGNNRIQQIDINGNFISAFGNNGSDAGQFSQLNKIALDKDSNLWASESSITNGSRLQKFTPYPKGTTAHPYKAIIVAGSGEKLGSHANELWEGTWQVAQKATKALHFQGFKPHEETLFLTAGNTQFDLDNNGQLDDLQAATKNSLRHAITEWAKDSTDVVLFLAGQTHSGQFQLSATETFTAQELSGWLADLEKALPANGKVTVVIEAPDAGSFVASLANPSRPRYVIASTQAKKPALMADHGVNSFSYTFWSRVMDGAPLAEAFSEGQQAVGPFAVDGQALQPAGDANGNGQADAQDAVAVGNYCLGMCNKTANQLPVINLPGQPSLTLKAASSLDFNVNVRPATNTHLLETWAQVQRPTPLDADPANALSLEKIPLGCDATQHCTGRYAHFDAPGQYRVHFYALDSQYQLNAPAFLDIAIQPENTSTLTAEYDSRQGLLTLRDVETSGQYYQAALQYQDGLYYLLTLGLTPNLLSPAARFDAATNLLDVPLARANGQDYQGSFRLVDNYLFQLLSTSPK